MRHYAAIAVLAATLACGADKSTRPLAPVAGSWTLISVDGAPLPATVQAANPKLDIVIENLIIRPNGTFEQARVLRRTNAGQVSDSLSMDGGTYDLYVAAAFLHFLSTGSTASAEVDGSTLTVSTASNSFVYQKQ